MTMVEKVAKAISNTYGPQMHWENCVVMARAAIEAMREPQVEMIAAFWRQKNTGTQEIGSTGDDRSDYDAWRAAIDAALNEVAG